MKKFEITPDDLRAGQTHVIKKIVDHLSSDTKEVKSEAKKDFSDIKELDLEGKVTVKEVAEAFNKLLAALKA